MIALTSYTYQGDQPPQPAPPRRFTARHLVHLGLALLVGYLCGRANPFQPIFRNLAGCSNPIVSSDNAIQFAADYWRAQLKNGIAHSGNRELVAYVNSPRFTERVNQGPSTTIFENYFVGVSWRVTNEVKIGNENFLFWTEFTVCREVLTQTTDMQRI